MPSSSRGPRLGADLSSFKKGSPSGNRVNGAEIDPINTLNKFSSFVVPAGGHEG
jgi:hypothetical protein